MNQWTIIIIVAIVGAVFFFVIQDWFNRYIAAANPLKTHKSTKK